VPASVTDDPEQTVVEGVAVKLTVGARPAFNEMAKLEGVPFPQLFVGVTVMFPELEPNVTFMVLVFCPDTIVVPVGTVQL
jgi:hypothetical protein